MKANNNSKLLASALTEINSSLLALDDFGSRLEASGMQSLTIAKVLVGMTYPLVQTINGMDAKASASREPNKVRAHLRAAARHLVAILSYAGALAAEGPEYLSGSRLVGAGVVLLVHAAGRRLDLAAGLVGADPFGWESAGLSEFDRVSK